LQALRCDPPEPLADGEVVEQAAHAQGAIAHSLPRDCCDLLSSLRIVGIWWAVVTVTTVGYGDLAPTTVAGRIVAIVLMFVGIGFLSVLTATIASFFVKSERSPESEEILSALQRVEGELAELRRQLAGH
jgi:hypothetical protein